MLQKSSVICIYFLARSSCKRFFSSCSSREQSINGRLFQSFPWVGGAVAAPVVFWWIWRSTAIIVIDPFGWLATFPRHYKYGKCLPCPFFQAITLSVIFDKYCQWQSFRTRSFYAFVMSWNNDIYDDNFFLHFRNIRIGYIVLRRQRTSLNRRQLALRQNLFSL